MQPEQPGTNGVQFSARTNFLYYTTTLQQLMLRVKAKPTTLNPADLASRMTATARAGPSSPAIRSPTCSELS